jgi:tetratricopeptide (TPR) repeat protein
MHTKFNPNQSTPETIKGTFTGRKQILETILDNITENVSRSHNQHILLTGPRGIGKTHLLRMIFIQVEEDLSLSKKWLVLQLAEEEYHGIANLRDFFERTLQAFQDRVEDPQPLPAGLNKSEIRNSIIETLEKWKTSTDDDQALDVYQQFWESFCQKEGRKLLLLVDNIDQIIESRSWGNIEEQKLRKLLMNEDWLMLIGTTPTYFQALMDPNRPLYQFFRVIPLAPLSDDEEFELLKKLAENQGDPAKLITRLSSKPEIMGRVRAINHLTGGNPRLTVMLHEIISHESIADVKDLLMDLLDELTPYYKSRIDELSPQQQKIIDTMARLEWDESLKKWARKNGGRVLIQALKETSYGVMATPSALSQITRLPQNQVNTILRRLDSLGYVRKAGTSRLRKQEDSLKSKRKDARLTIYELSEPFFRIYHQYRYSRRWQRQFQVFITFLRIWFTEKELRVILQNQRLKYSEYIQADKPKEANRILEGIRYLEAALKYAIRKTKSDTDKKIQELLVTGQLDECKELLEKMLLENQQKQDRDEISKNLFGLGLVNYSMALKAEDVEQANRYFQESIEKYKKAIEIKPDNHEAYSNWGVSLSNLALRSEGKQISRLLQESIEKYKKAIEIKPDEHEAYNNWGSTLFELARRSEGEQMTRLFQESFEKYKKATEIKPDKYDAYYNWGTALSSMAQRSEGEQATQIFQESSEKFKKATDFKPDDHEAYNNWGNALSNLAQRSEGEQATQIFQESFEKYKNAIKIKPDKHDAYYNWGTALLQLAQISNDDQATQFLQESLDKFQKATEIKPDMYDAYQSWALALIGYYEETENRKFLDLSLEKIYKSMELAPDNAQTVDFFIYIILKKTELAILENNWGLAENSFKEAISKFNLVSKNLLLKLLMGYFKSWISPSRRTLFQNMLKFLEENERKDEIALIQPFIWANLYWQQDRDPEVLERIPQEMRTIVAEIIQKGEERDKKETKSD